MSGKSGSGKSGESPEGMASGSFRSWRKGLGLSQKQAAELLGLKRRVVQYYEKGERDGKAVEVPRTVRLACYALESGVTDFTGPGEAVRDALPKRSKKKKKD